jgi:hypothetical protein
MVHREWSSRIKAEQRKQKGKDIIFGIQVLVQGLTDE